MTLNLMVSGFFKIPGPQWVQSGHHIMQISICIWPILKKKCEKNVHIHIGLSHLFICGIWMIYLLFDIMEGPPSSQNLSIFLIPTNHPSDSRPQSMKIPYTFWTLPSTKTQNICTNQGVFQAKTQNIQILY